MKELVISGCVSKGALAGSIADYLNNECGHKYDFFVGY